MFLDLVAHPVAGNEFTRVAGIPEVLPELAPAPENRRARLRRELGLAPFDIAILLANEPPSWVDLGLVARAIHELLGGGPFIEVNCAAIPEELIESELFGHARGAFTGAVADRRGKFELAHGGTLFLDEIGELPLSVQGRLLRLLQDRSFLMVGGTRPVPADVRFVFATHRDLPAMVQARQFREDLYYRLNVVPVRIPSLAERRDDIPVLVGHFMKRLSAAGGLPMRIIGDDAMAVLQTHGWPGNVRQLQSALFRAAVLCDRDALTPEEFPQISAAVGVPGNGGSGGAGTNDGIGVTLYENDGNMRPLEEIEADVIRLAIGHYRGRMTEVARRLGIGRSTLYRKLADLGISDAA